MTANRSFSIAAFALAAALAAPLARADEPTATNQTLAQSLFDEAVKLMDQGNFAAACPKLAESQRLDPGGGTLLNLGFCREKEGKLASAWAAYDEALSQAIKDGRKDREGTARAHVDDLGGKVAKLAIDVSDAARKIDGLTIRLDNVQLRQAAWGVLSPIDKGEHGIVVTAPGKRDYKTTVTVAEDGGVQRVSIPALVDAPVVPHPRLVGMVAAPERRGGPQATIGWITGGVGLALVAMGGVTGGLALDQHAKSNADNGGACGALDHCTQDGVDAENRAKTFAWLSDVGLGLGAAALVTGLVLVLTAPRSPHVVPVVTAHGAGAAFATSF